VGACVCANAHGLAHIMDGRVFAGMKVGPMKLFGWLPRGPGGVPAAQGARGDGEGPGAADVEPQLRGRDWAESDACWALARGGGKGCHWFGGHF